MGRLESDPRLRNTEEVPLNESISEYMKREVFPHIPDAWVDEAKTTVGYKISFERYFYTFVQPRPLQDIENDLKTIQNRIAKLTAEVMN